ncbi:MAG: biopolymer transporter ExbD [Coleofasciculaceae cyanobacterium SM2_1_6]|nr:biopolymer transporter ExbD [Coleofasciculaceae cyanobacterium SM2_1_6]
MPSESPKKFSVNPPAPLRIRLDTQTEEVQVNIIPLIDVIFCILTFFILAAVGLSRQQAINVDLPRAETGVAQARQLLVVSLDGQGNVFIEQQPVRSREEFLQQLVQYLEQNPNGLMSLYASPNATYDQVVQLLDLLRSVGGDRVALATLPSGVPSTPSPTITPSFSPTLPGQTPSNLNPQINPQLNPQTPGQNLNQTPRQTPNQAPNQTPANRQLPPQTTPQISPQFSPQLNPSPPKTISPGTINPNGGTVNP